MDETAPREESAETETTSLTGQQQDPPNPEDVALLVVSDAGALLSSNHRVAELFSAPAEILSEGSANALVSWLERSADEVATKVASVLRSARTVGGEIFAGDGRRLAWTRTRLGGAEPGWVFSFRDARRERAAFQALTDAETWLLMFAKYTGGAVLEVDARGRIVGTWSADGEVLSVPEAELQGRTFAEAIGGGRATEIDALVRSVIASGAETRLEYTAETNDETKVYSLDASLLPSDGQGAAVVSVLVRDITVQTRMQTQLVQTERLASVGLLAAGVAHEVNNPLTYMLINFQRVRRGIRELADPSRSEGALALASELETCVDMMIEGAERVRDIVQDLQRFSRSDRNDTYELVDVRSVVRHTLGPVSFELKRHARVVLELGPVPLVLASEGRLGQVFLNLLLNAVHALGHPDPARHVIRLATSTDTDGNAVIEVHDTGCGIAEHDLRRIFDPFFTTKPPTVGTGLGLAICHGITRSLGGTIRVESKLGVGTMFRVVLPPGVAEPRDEDYA